MSQDTIQDRATAVKDLLEAFRLERLVYLAVNIVSLIVLLVSAVVLLVKGAAEPAELVGLFGSSGAITYSTGRILRMWSDAVRVLSPSSAQEER